MLKINATIKDIIQYEIQQIYQSDLSGIRVSEVNMNDQRLDHVSYLCNFCTRTIKNEPIGIPYLLDGITFHCTGYFCSFKCANTYLSSSFDNDRDTRMNLLNYLYYKMTGDNGPIGYAPPKEILVKFGGVMNDTEYESCLNNGEEIKYISELPPIIHNVKSINSVSIMSKMSICNSINTYGKINLSSYESKSFGLNKGYRICRPT